MSEQLPSTPRAGDRRRRRDVDLRRIGIMAAEATVSPRGASATADAECARAVSVAAAAAVAAAGVGESLATRRIAIAWWLAAAAIFWMRCDAMRCSAVWRGSRAGRAARRRVSRRER
ncbi:hypothetical protein [Burkholderia sp. MSMB617WGS]|uniref:hypothetical protein n=1 Tax=Burkholderia sp. MSMB617WGS TaxID=1637831 RepID=UPI000A7FE750|nr:hypothetical protein [Burkholderia sp. MSMB617WGS]